MSRPSPSSVSTPSSDAVLDAVGGRLALPAAASRRALARGVTHVTELVEHAGVPVAVLRLAPPGPSCCPGLDIVARGRGLLARLDAPGVPRPRRAAARPGRAPGAAPRARAALRPRGVRGRSWDELREHGRRAVGAGRPGRAGRAARAGAAEAGGLDGAGGRARLATRRRRGARAARAEPRADAGRSTRSRRPHPLRGGHVLDARRLPAGEPGRARRPVARRPGLGDGRRRRPGARPRHRDDARLGRWWADDELLERYRAGGRPAGDRAAAAALVALPRARDGGGFLAARRAGGWARAPSSTRSCTGCGGARRVGARA